MMKLDCVVITPRRSIEKLDLDLLYKGEVVSVLSNGDREVLASFMIIPKEVYVFLGEKLNLRLIFELDEIDVDDYDAVFRELEKKFIDKLCIRYMKINAIMTLTRPDCAAL